MIATKEVNSKNVSCLDGYFGMKPPWASSGLLSTAHILLKFSGLGGCGDGGAGQSLGKSVCIYWTVFGDKSLYGQELRWKFETSGGA